MYLPAIAEEQTIALDELTPREIVAELDKYVVGSMKLNAPWPSRCATACAGRSSRRTRRRDHAQDIIMIGPTGVGKTEIARRLAKLANSPS